MFIFEADLDTVIGDWKYIFDYRHLAGRGPEDRYTGATVQNDHCASVLDRLDSDTKLSRSCCVSAWCVRSISRTEILSKESPQINASRHSLSIQVSRRGFAAGRGPRAESSDSVFVIG